MDESILFLTMLIIITIIYAYLERKKSQFSYFKSNINGESYLVREDMEDSQEASDMLAKISINCSKLVDHLMKPEQIDGNMKHLKDRILSLKNRWNPKNISESSPDNKYTSYSINKGEKIVFCLRDKNMPYRLTDINTIMFVAIHELAHLMTEEIGHPPIFWKHMASLLKESIDIGIYTPVDYKINPKLYCGMEINNTPCDHTNCSDIPH